MESNKENKKNTVVVSSNNEEMKEVISCHINKILNETDHNPKDIWESSGIEKTSYYNVLKGIASVDTMLKVVKVLDSRLYEHIKNLIIKSK
jgi:predicted transcriptional regulator